MTTPFTLRDWLGDPRLVVEAMFAADGPASRFPGYVRNPVQVDYAVNLARVMVKGASPGGAGKVVPTEAGTATGKTLAILVVGMTNAVLRRKRTLVSTYTRFLNRQMVGKDGTAAMDIVQAATGVRPTLALRRPRSAFASPTACRNAAGMLRAEAGESAEPGRLLESATALVELADWTEAELARFRDDVAGALSDFAGLIETFREAHPKFESALDRVPYEHYALDGTHGAAEQASFLAYRTASRDVDLLVTTHAALVIDQSLGGALLDPAKNGFGAVVVDEANRLEDAGRAALGTKRSVSLVKNDRPRVMTAMSGLRVDVRVRDEIAANAFLHQEKADELLAALLVEGEKREVRATRQHRVTGEEAWLPLVEELGKSSRRLVESLRKHPCESFDDIAASLMRRQADFDSFLDCVRKNRESRARPGEFLKNGDFAHAVVDYSPFRHDPSLLTVPKRGARVVSRLWKREAGPSADCVILTSATLAAPNLQGFPAFRSMLHTVGLELDSPNVDADLARQFHLRRLGEMRELILARPDETRPSRRGADGYEVAPEWLSYVADGVKAALDDVWKKDRNRVVVLATSFADAAALRSAVEEVVVAGDVVVRGQDESLEAVTTSFGLRDRGVLILVGAWDGMDRPGLIDHLVIPRLPFPPPETNRKAATYTFVAKDGERQNSHDKEIMLRLLTQGIGRAFRVPSDAAKVWILDPRIGVPPEVEVREGVMSDGDKDFLSAVPRRFERALEEARLFERVRPVGPAPRGKGKGKGAKK